MTTALGEAPGKIILLGEHAVVYRHPALAVPVHERKAQAAVELNGSGAVLLEGADLGQSWSSESRASRELAPFADVAVAALHAFGGERFGITATLRSAIPIGCGMGSSAAIAVALVRAIAAALERPVRAEEAARLAMIAERILHGNPSGIDAEVVARGVPLLFSKRRGATPIEPKDGAFCLAVADSGKAASTAAVVGDVARARARDAAHYDSIFWELGALAAAGAAVLRKGSPAELGLLMTRAHELLRAIGVSCDELDRLVAAALGAGAAGAKLSGAGRGGIVVAVLESEDAFPRVGRAMRAAGARDCFAVKLEPAKAAAAAGVEGKR